MDVSLSKFYQSCQEVDFWRGVDLLCAFYKVQRPNIEWFEYLGHGKILGLTWSDGRIQLIHPENWKGKRAGTERTWVRTVLHEWWHYLTFVEDEQKADQYARRFCHGLREKLTE